MQAMTIVTAKTPQRDHVKLIELAEREGLTRGDRPNVSAALRRALARGLEVDGKAEGRHATATT
jgi:hypothetical protein